jgi:hypothetical protein
MKKPTEAECATILAALRYWQEYRQAGGLIPVSFDHFDEVAPLTVKEIDELCDSINLGGTK